MSYNSTFMAPIESMKTALSDCTSFYIFCDSTSVDDRIYYLMFDESEAVRPLAFIEYNNYSMNAFSKGVNNDYKINRSLYVTFQKSLIDYYNAGFDKDIEIVSEFANDVGLIIDELSTKFGSVNMLDVVNIEIVSGPVISEIDEQPKTSIINMVVNFELF